MADNEFVPASAGHGLLRGGPVPCGLFCTYGNVSELESDSWVTVTGILYGEQYKGQEEPRLRVTSVVPAKPIEGYIFPYSGSLTDWDGGYWFRQVDFQFSLSFTTHFQFRWETFRLSSRTGLP